MALALLLAWAAASAPLTALGQGMGWTSMMDAQEHVPIDETGVSIAVSSKSCGINGILNKKTWQYEEPKGRLRLECSKRMTTNCSVSYYPMKCPSDCQYLVPNVAFSCLFQCVKAEECSQSNPNRAFPNKKTGMCEPCAIQGCKECSSQTKCKLCHKSFRLSPDEKSCVFYMDQDVNWTLIVAILGIAVGGLLVFGIIWFCLKGPHPNWERNMVAIIRARRHRHMTKVYNWQLESFRNMRSVVGLAENVHKKNVLGVGLALYYNNVIFLIMISVIFWVSSMILFESSDVAKALNKFEDPPQIIPIDPDPLYQPAVILSPLAMCKDSSGAKTQDEIMGYARNNFVMIGILYLVTFILSLIFGLLQRRAARKFDEMNSTMSDYALLIKGLPEDQTEEPTLKTWLETEFRKVCPGLWQRPSKVIHKLPPEQDEIQRRAPSEMEVFGVSVCYNYREQWAEVDDTMWKEMEQMEVDMHHAAKVDPWELDENNTTAGERGVSHVQMRKQNRDKVLAWFADDSDQKLKGTGEMFCVFRYLPDKYRLLRYLEAHPDFLRHPSQPDKPLAFQHVFSEPNCIAWWFVGLSRSVIIKRTLRNFFWILFVIACVQVFVVMPYARFVLLPYATTGSAAGGMKTTIAGIVLGWVNGMLFPSIFMTAVKLGYARKDMMDTFVLFTSAILVLLNTMFNISITVIMVMSQNDAMGGVIRDLLDGKTLKAVGTENAIAKNIYQMLMPGSFFVGLVMAMVMAGWVPFLVNTCLMKIIYIWKCFPDGMLKIIKIFLPWSPGGLEIYPFRSAEKAFEPWEVPICGTYADQIVTPTICMIFLHFASPYTHKCFLGMLGWSTFEYFYFRYMHLRYHKTCYYTTSRLDSFNNLMWGLPLSVIASATCHWGFRSEIIGKDWRTYTKLFALMAVFTVSCLCWIGAYRLVVKPFQLVETDDEQQEETVEELSKQTVYTWFNCNTPFVLKCKYYYMDDNGKKIKSRLGDHPIACGEDENQVRFFEVGKQTLFLKPERQIAVIKNLKPGPLEFETWFEKMLLVMDYICRGCRCGKEGRSTRRTDFSQRSEIEMGLLDSERGS